MEEKVINLICTQLGLDIDKVTLESSFVDDLFCDSLDIVELLSVAEDQFGMSEIPEERLAQMKTVGDLVSYVEETM